MVRGMLACLLLLLRVAVRSIPQGGECSSQQRQGEEGLVHRQVRTVQRAFSSTHPLL
jgi:hypothetical protein